MKTVSVEKTREMLEDHINAVGPVTIPQARQWLADQVSDDPDVLTDAIADPRFRCYSEDEESWITTPSQDPR